MNAGANNKKRTWAAVGDTQAMSWFTDAPHEWETQEKENMKQKVYNNLPALLAAGNHASAGAATHAATLGLVDGTKVLIDGALNALVTARDAYELAKGELATRREARVVEQKKVYDLLFGSRDLLRRTLGKQYSPAWQGTGFNFSLEVPRSIAKLQSVAGTLKAFLVENPALERVDLMTAAKVDDALEALTDADTAVTQQESAVGTALTNRRDKEKALRLRLRWTIDELGRKIGPLDDRWTAFGFNKPGLKETPPVPVGLTYSLVNNVAARLKWEKAARAEHYRIWLLITGQDEVASVIGTAADLSFMLENLPSGTQGKVSVSAVNNGGESARSEAIDVSIP